MVLSLNVNFALFIYFYLDHSILQHVLYRTTFGNKADALVFFVIRLVFNSSQNLTVFLQFINCVLREFSVNVSSDLTEIY